LLQEKGTSSLAPVMRLFLVFALWIFAPLVFSGCREHQTPKPRGYFKIILPERSYRTFGNESCPFTFEYPAYGVVNRDSVFLDTVPDNPCWLNITFPSLNGNLHLSYKEITSTGTLQKLIDDAHRLTFKHTIKAEFIDESFIKTPHDVSGIMFDVGGNAASSLQFYVTDSSKHFLRGSLYFLNTPNADSIAPVLRFIRPDVIKMLETLRWTDEK
jgi:gliding motility-associated lipoprotein GldD